MVNHYKALPYVVQTYTGNLWETVAAFNVDRAAYNYKHACEVANHPVAYRVILCKANGHRRDNVK